MFKPLFKPLRNFGPVWTTPSVGQTVCEFPTQSDKTEMQDRESNRMDSWGLVAIILCCGLFAQNMLTTQKLKKLQERIDKLDTSNHTRV